MVPSMTKQTKRKPKSQPKRKDRKPREKPVSLRPLTVEEAIKGLLETPPGAKEGRPEPDK